MIGQWHKAKLNRHHASLLEDGNVVDYGGEQYFITSHLIYKRVWRGEGRFAKSDWYLTSDYTILPKVVQQAIGTIITSMQSKLEDAKLRPE